MNSNEFFMYLAPRCLLATLAINTIIAIFCFFRNKRKFTQKLWWNLRLAIVELDIFLSVIFFMIIFFVPNSAISGFLPTINKNKTIVLPAETIEITNTIEKENIIEIPSIMLPLQPEGEQAIVIDTSSKELNTFMKNFYGKNVEFFNQRQNATYLYNNGEFHNYTGLDLDGIQYEQGKNDNILNLNQLEYETIWLFTDLKNVQFKKVDCKLIVYIPHAITEAQLEELKSLGDVTVITIDEVR